MQNSIEAKFNFIDAQIKLLKDGFNRTFYQKIDLFQSSINNLKQNYILNNPENKDKTGFVQISKENKIISLESLEVDDILELQSAKTIASCKIISLKKQK